MEIGIGIISDVGQFSFSRKEEFSSPSLLFLPLVSTLEEAESAERGGVKKRKHQERVRSWLRPSCLPGTPPAEAATLNRGWRTLKLAILLLSWAAPPHCRGDYFCDLKCLTTSHDLRATGESVGCEQARGGVGLKRPQGETQLFHGCARGAHLLLCGSQPAQGTVRNGG